MNCLGGEISVGISTNPTQVFDLWWKEKLKKFIVWPQVFPSVLVC